jgi:hypothetical protein
MKDRRRLERCESEAADGIRAYWERYAEAFATPLQGNGLLGNFVSNTAVTGAYAEAWVRSLAETMVTTLAISTGAIVRTTDVVKGHDLRQVPQSDLIFWDPAELSALFRTGSFALVHTQAARGVVEVKRTLASAGSLKKQLRDQQLRLLSEYRRNVLGVVIAHECPLFGDGLDPEWVENAGPADPPRMVRLLDKNTSSPDPEGIFALIYFLTHLARGGLAASSTEC